MITFKEFSESKETYKVGVVGYFSQKFDKKKAAKLISKAFDEVEKDNKDRQFECVSGLSNAGIIAIAYKEAVSRGWKTVGVACEKAHGDLFPVDKKILVGKDWGDESKTFVNMLDCLVRIGGGEQSLAETKMAKDKNIKVIEFELQGN